MPVNSDVEYGEEVRLTYRYLDLRRKKMQKNLRLRHAAAQVARAVMIKNDFLKVFE